MANEEKPTIRWQTYAVAAFLIGTAWVVPPFRDMFKEMRDFSTGVSVPLSLMTRVVVGVPSAVWVAFGFLVAAGLIWKSKLVSRKASNVVDMTAVVVWFVAGMTVVIALFRPLIRLQ